MGKRILFVLVLGGCFNLNFDFGAGDSGCATCHSYDAEGASCDSTAPTCTFSHCSCSPSNIVVCPRDLSVPLDLSTSPHDIATTDGGDGFD